MSDASRIVSFGGYMSTVSKKPAVTVTPTTEQDLVALRSAFVGEIEPSEMGSVPDDVLIAGLLGWHLRAAPIKPSRLDSYFFTEFAYRRAITSGAEVADLHSGIRDIVRGCVEPTGQILSPNGLTPETGSEIRARVARVIELVEKIQAQDMVNIAVGSDDESWRLVAHLTDQEIIDVAIWSALKSCSDAEPRKSELPSLIEHEMLARTVNSS